MLEIAREGLGSSRSVEDRQANAIQGSSCLIVPEAERFEALAFEVGVALDISFRSGMSSSVDFNNQSRSRRGQRCSLQAASAAGTSDLPVVCCAETVNQVAPLLQFLALSSPYGLRPAR